ncbi:DUF4789 domain-containing protein [Camponotus japonicus]
MKCLYISIVLLMYNYMMIFGQLRSHDESSYINVDNGTGITERIPWSSKDSYEEHHCPKNMSLYSVDDAMDVWICECKRGFLYFPLNDSCHEPYRQGPCSSKNYLVLPKNETVARCVENPCLEDGMVPYNGTCYPLQTIGSPDPIEILDEEKTTFGLLCKPPYICRVPSFIGHIPTKNCPSGSRRSLKSEACIKVQAHHN